MIRKHIIVILLCLSNLVLMCSCAVGTLFDSIGNYFSDIPYEHKMANAELDLIIEAIQDRDTDSLKSLFAKDAIERAENIDQSISELFDYFQGSLVSYEAPSGMSINQTWENGEKQAIYRIPYLVITSENRYQVAMKLYLNDSGTKELYSFCIIKKDDDIDSERAYMPSDIENPGIHVGVKNAIPRGTETNP